MALDKIPFLKAGARREIEQIRKDSRQAANVYGSGGATSWSMPGSSNIQQAEQQISNWQFIGKIAGTGPNGQANFTNEMYWVISNEIGIPAKQAVLSPLSLFDTSAPGVIYNSGSYWIPVTNLKETQAHSHMLAIDTPVTVFGFAAQGEAWYYMMEGLGTGTFKARITAVSGSFPVWTYTVQRLVSINTTSNVAATRYVTDGHDLTAYNGFESAPASGFYIHPTGVNVDSANGDVATTYGGTTDGTCVMRAIGIGAVVDVSATVDQSGNLAYLFSAPNSAQGS